MRLSKCQRERLRQKFGGRCAYCGEALGERWHADHFVALHRRARYVRGRGLVTMAVEHAARPHMDTEDNLMPACAPCNIDKHGMALEAWRRKLQDTANVLRRNYPTYRHALRFGLVRETGARVAFYFEQVRAIRCRAALPKED
mgnify:FL=1